MKRRTLLMTCGAGLVSACSSMSDTPDPAAKRRDIDAAVSAALANLSGGTPKAAELIGKASGVLVFPKVVSAGFVVGGSYGQGAMRKGGATAGYYSVGAGSVGLLAGAETRAVYLLFMTPEALQKFEASSGWTAGADASVVVLDDAAAGRVDTLSGQSPIVGFVRGTGGLMANLSLDGTKINKLTL
jgi:lipid-binding SYLF domain-containing protein